MKKYKTHIAIVSDQVIPNVTPVLDETIRPEKVILCASNRMKGRADTLAAFFKSKQIETELFSLGDAYDFAELQERFMELAIRLEHEKSVAVNLTGGNKLMTIAAQMVFDARPRFYVVPQKDQLMMIDAQSPGRYEIQDRITLRDYFAIHGYTVISQKRKKKINPDAVTLAESILKNYGVYKQQLAKLNAVASEAEKIERKTHRPCLTIHDDFNEGVCELIHLFATHGSITYYDDKKIEFASNESRSFCKGFWLEDYILNELSKVNDAIGLQDWAGSIQIKSASGTKNEIDAAFLYNNELYVIECKTARMDDKGDDVLYKIDTIRGYAGLYTKSIVASFKELNKSDRRRAEDLRITLIEGKNLNRFAERMIEKIHPKGETE